MTHSFYLKESLKRPISGSDFGYEIPLKDRSAPYTDSYLYNNQEAITERLNEIKQDGEHTNK